VAEGDEAELVATYDFSTDREELSAMSVGELKRIMKKYAISSVGCVEKGDMVDAIVNSGMVEITDQPVSTDQPVLPPPPMPDSPVTPPEL